ncbi:anti-sigma-K factor RskA [Nocardioides ginsengisegetis]|uniref:Regulator of SigK n=1 Tax=Nocardioides ginsengisegetis TaxID=661491 RepID=A0A7W3J433_9ACTN|nr:anti-sigma factor [Nocardioides ginsengisegetis]MBA8805819.1 anti-sigma-K factor RskA [Nocardioides ginsengisegetis]
MIDIHALSGAYAIDALDDIERAQFERHLAVCADCQAEVDSLREASALLPETTMAAPPEGLRARVLADITAIRPLPPLTGTNLEPADAPANVVPLRRPLRRRLTGLVAAAAAVAAIGTGAVWQPWHDSTSQTQLSAADRIRNAPDAVTVTQRVDGGQATVIASKSLNQLLVSTEGLPPLPAGKVYEMWLQDADEGMVPVPGGLMTAADATVVLDGNLANALGAGITVEPAGGSHVPTTEPVALFAFENA